MLEANIIAALVEDCGGAVFRVGEGAGVDIGDVSGGAVEVVEVIKIVSWDS